MDTKIETMINEMTWVEAPAQQRDIYHDALVETGRIASTTLDSFKVLENVGRVVLVEFVPTNKIDPIAPIILDTTNAARRAARAFIALLYQPGAYMFYPKAREAAARYLSTCQWLQADELAYLEKQLQLCVVDPLRKITRGQE